jgi:hypothetical protein
LEVDQLQIDSISFPRLVREDEDKWRQNQWLNVSVLNIEDFLPREGVPYLHVTVAVGDQDTATLGHLQPKNSELRIVVQQLLLTQIL